MSRSSLMLAVSCVLKCLYSLQKLNFNILGLEDFERKIDQIAANEKLLANQIDIDTTSDDTDWITNLYRRFNGHTKLASTGLSQLYTAKRR